MSCILIALLRKSNRFLPGNGERLLSCMVYGQRQADHGVEAGKESV